MLCTVACRCVCTQYTTQNNSKLHQTMMITVDDDKSDNNDDMIMMMADDTRQQIINDCVCVWCMSAKCVNCDGNNDDDVGDSASDDVDRSTGAADSAWMLLQTYMHRHGDKSCRYHRCTAAKLLQHGFTLPVWLTAEYKVHTLLNIIFLSVL